jgi:site-specific recombinase
VNQFTLIDRQLPCPKPRLTKLGIVAALSDNESVPNEPANPPGVAGSVADRIPDESMPSPVPLQVAPRELVDSIEAFCQASSLNERTAALIRLVGWIRKPGTSVADLSGLDGFIEYLEANTDQRTRFQAAFAELLSQLNCVSLFAEAGIPSDHSFLSEIGYRVSARLLPSAREQTDAAKLLVTLYPNEKNVRRFLASPPELFQRLVAVLTRPGDPQFASHEHQDLLEALRLLASRISTLGLEPEVRARASSPGVSDSPFYQIVARTEELIVATESTATPTVLAPWQGVVHRCRTEMVRVHQDMETAGVSVELIFDLRKIGACVARMEAIVDVLTAETHDAGVSAVHGLVGHLMEGRLSDLSLSALLRDNLNLIARKMVERTGHSGEHYIAHNRPEYWQMWRAALGGGLLTVITAGLKMRILDAHLPPFIEGFASGTNYAISFVILQMLGLVLATKQPAATAATFAGIIRENRGLERENKLTDFVSRITSTQLAAALGNVFAVSLGALAFERLWRLLFSTPFLSTESATHVYETLHPLASGTAFYAAITGVILWMAALIGGWCENFAVFYRLTDAVAQHPMGIGLGEPRMNQLAAILKRNLGGWSTSIALGYLLGFTPVFGHFFGLPLDVRHVTLSTGTLSLAVAHFGAASVSRNWFYQAVAGIGVIFILNLFVSFSIAAYVGLRAYNVRPKEQLEILRFLVVNGLKSPLRFMWPNYMRNSSAVEVHSSDQES